MSRKFYSHGKLLITGEYLVLEGALALAVPTRFGQSLEVKETSSDVVAWKALDYQNNIWFQTQLKHQDKSMIFPEGSSQGQHELRLRQILTQAHSMNPRILADHKGLEVVTRLEFPQNWGLGSSSTLINNVARWFGIDPYELLARTFKGSGYDIAAAQTKAPITYQLLGRGRSVLKANFDPPFADKLFFVYLNRKQNSRSSIVHYQQQSKAFFQEKIQKISALTQRFIACQSIEEFNLLIEIHETIIASSLNTVKVKTRLFPDFEGAIKSLGGWGGDFILATGGEHQREYFKNKGYNTILPYAEIIS